MKTIDVGSLATQVGNIFEAVAILSKRARQISVKTKGELDERLSYYEGFDTETEDPRFQEEQTRISLEYELMPKPTEMAIREMFNGDIYHRLPSEDETPHYREDL
jgi:DNA-directed RNA polymerase subunit K/omega